MYLYGSFGPYQFGAFSPVMVVQGISERETGMLSEEEIDTLRNKSIESLSMSYSPYSKFRYGLLSMDIDT